MTPGDAFVVVYGETDLEGWTEVLYKTGALINEGEADESKLEFDEQTSEVIGFVRVVEGTEGGPTQWWDARAFACGTMHERRFIGQEAVVFALALRRFSEAESRKALGW